MCIFGTFSEPRHLEDASPVSLWYQWCCQEVKHGTGQHSVASVCSHLDVFGGGFLWLTNVWPVWWLMASVEISKARSLVSMALQEAVTVVCTDNRDGRNCLCWAASLPLRLSLSRNYFPAVSAFTSLNSLAASSDGVTQHSSLLSLLSCSCGAGERTAPAMSCGPLRFNCTPQNSRLTPSGQEGFFLPCIALIFQGISNSLVSCF